MANYRAIMQLSLAGRSYAEIVEMVGCSRRDVALVKKTISRVVLGHARLEHFHKRLAQISDRMRA